MPVQIRQDSANRRLGPDYLDYREQNKSFVRIANTCRVLPSPGPAKASRSWSIAPPDRKIFSRRSAFGLISAGSTSRVSTVTSKMTRWLCHTGSGRRSLAGILMSSVAKFDSKTRVSRSRRLPPMSDLFPDTDVWPKLTTRRVAVHAVARE